MNSAPSTTVFRHDPSSFFALRKWLLVLPALTLALAGNAQAAVDTWTGPSGTTTSPISGAWDNATTGNWSTAGVWVPGSDATFGGTSTGIITLTLGAAITANTLQFTSTTDSYTLAGTNTITLSLNNDPGLGGTGAQAIQLATGVTAIIGSGVTLQEANPFNIGSTTPSTSATAGTLIVNGAIKMNLASGNNSINNGATVQVNTGGSITTNGANLNLGRNESTTAGSPDTLDVNGGAVTIATGGGLLVGRGHTAGVVTIENGGTITFGSNSGVSFGNGGANGTFNLGTGTLSVGLGGGIILGSGGTSTFNFNGGTLKATGTGNATTGVLMGSGSNGAGLGALSAANVLLGAVIDTNGFATSITQALLHGGVPAIDGGLTKQGAGTLTLTGANTYTGTTTLAAGTLNAGVADVANTSGALGKNGTITFTGGTLQYSVASASTDYSSRILSSSGAISIDTNAQSATFATGLAASNTGGLTKLGTGTLNLTGTNLYTGATSVNAGTLSLTGSLGTNGGTGSNVSTAGAAVFSESSAGAINGSGVTFTQGSSGTSILAGTNTYTGATSINAGTLNLTGALGNTAVTVASGATLTGTGNNSTTGLIGGLTTVNGGGAITISGGTPAQILTVNGLTLGNTSGTYAANHATLNFTLSTSGAELIDIGTAGSSTGALTLNSTGAYIALTGTPILGSTTTLMNFGSETLNGSFSLSSTTAGVTTLATGFNTYTLNDTGTQLTLSYTGNATPGVAYFAGTVSNVWNDASLAPTSNWSSNKAGTTDANNTPGSTTDVILNADNKTGAVTTTLGANTIINSLNVNANASGATTVGNPGDITTLQINAQADGNTDGVNYTGNTAGTGINIASGAGAVTINVPLILGTTGALVPASQTWTNGSANLFTVTGSVTGLATIANPQTLTLQNTSTGGTAISGIIGNGAAGGTVGVTINNTGSGSGLITTLSGANTYTGATTVSAGTLKAGVATVGGVSPTSGAFGVNSAVTVASGATLDLNGFNETIGSLADNAGSGGTVTSSTAGAITLITGGNNTSTSYAGIIQDGSGTVALTKIGTGTQTLSGVNTYTGATTISAGTLAIGGAGSLGSGSYAGNIANAGTFNYGSSANQTLSGVISGTGALTMGGSGTLTLTGVNTYTGATTISAGTLAITGTGSLNSGAYAGAITDNGTLNYASSANQTLSGVISGTGALIMNGAGTLTLSNSANSFSGGLTIKAGTLTSSGVGTTNNLGSGTITIGDNGNTGAAARLNVIPNGGTTTYTNALATVGTGVNTLNLQDWFATFSGGLTLGGNLVLSTTNGNQSTLTLSGAISGTGNLTTQVGGTNGGSSIVLSNASINNMGTITNSGTNTVGGGTTVSGAIGSNVTGVIQNSATSPLTLSNAGNAFSGLTIKSGKVTAKIAGSLGSGTIALGDAAVNLASTLDYNGAGASATFSNAISVNGSGVNTLSVTAFAPTYTGAVTLNTSNLTLISNNVNGSTLSLSGNISGTGNLITQSNAVGLPAGKTSNITLGGSSINNIGTITNNGTGTNGAAADQETLITGNIGTNVTGVIQNSAGSGLVLSGTNTYTGPTTVSAGTLKTLATGNLGAGDVTVAAGATLTLGNFSSINDTGALIVSDTSIVNLNFTTGTETIGSLFSATGSQYVPVGTYTVGQLNSSFGFGAGTFTSNDINNTLTVTAVPEPSVLILIGAGIIVLTVFRRRQIQRY